MNRLRIAYFFIAFSAVSVSLDAQVTGVSGGLAFSSGLDYNTGKTGNPGYFAKAWIEFDKRLHLVPSVTAFNKFKKSDFNKTLKTFMFHGDLDLMYGIYKDRGIRVLGFGGVNATLLSSKWDITFDEGLPLVNLSDLKPGVNIGGALQLYVNDGFDAYVSAKYILGNFNQAVINIGAIYYFGAKHRKGSW